MARKSEPLLGFHVSISKSIDLAVDRALEIGCTTFQIFTRNPRGWRFSSLDEAQVALFREKRTKAGYAKVVAHMPYLPNLASSIRSIQRPSRASLKEELARCEKLGVDYLVAHIGSHMGEGIAAGIRNTVGACNEALDGNPGGKTVLLVETMAGQKNCIGGRFEELRAILDGVRQQERIGVCVDTCHIFVAGFDITDKPSVDHAMGLFGEVVGYDRMKVVHLNDSRGALGSGLDRHEHIGMGKIGETGLHAFLHYRSNDQLPILMETPVDDRRKDEVNLELAKRMLSRKIWARPAS